MTRTGSFRLPNWAVNLSPKSNISNTSQVASVSSAQYQAVNASALLNESPAPGAPRDYSDDF